jgi:hypothetical protein
MKESASVLPIQVSQQIQNWLALLMLCLIVSFITACDYGMTQGNQLSKKDETPPPFHSQKDLSLDDMRDIAKKSDKDINITKDYSAQNTPSNMPSVPAPVVQASMAGNIGFKTNMLFEEKLSSSEERFNRLERVVQNMADRFTKIEPAIERLVQIDNDLSILTTQLEVLLNKKEQQDQTIPVNAIDNAQQANEIIPLAGSQAASRRMNENVTDISLYGLRLSDHASKARIVMDSSSRFEFDRQLEAGQLIVQSDVLSQIDFDNLNIQNLSSVVTNIQQNGNGDLVLSLSRDVNDTKIGRIEPSDKNPDYRTYIDLIF